MFSELNDKQLEAISSKDGPLLIVAGAGSGKTKTLTSRFAWLILNKKAKLNEVLAITFTNKSANEMKSRVFKILKDNNIKIDSNLFVGTFHSFGAMVLRQNAMFFERNNLFSIYDRNDSIRIIKKIIKNFNFLKEKDKKSPSYFLKIFSKIKSRLLSFDDIYNMENGGLLFDLFNEYENMLKKQNAFDFDDLIQKVVELWKKNKNILNKYSNKYKYILIDEYQDINDAQYEMIKLLSKKHNNINAVGDDQQSIYGFRFSDFRNFLNFEKDWPSAKVIFLEQNYRSTKKIISAASELISHNVNQKHKNLWTKNSEGNHILVIEHKNEFEEADFISDYALKHLSKKNKLGILFRTNAQSRAIEQSMIEKGIDYSIYGALSFYQRKEIKDIVSALRAINNPKDILSISRMEKVFYKKKTEKILEKTDDKKIYNTNPKKIIEWIINLTDYNNYIKRHFTNPKERMENIKELIYFSSQFNDLDSFLKAIALSSPLDNRRKKSKLSDNIILMTIHLSKGLEFDSVIIAGVNEGIIPHKQSFFLIDEIEEERRLMYVAMTRAKKELCLSFYGTPSRFLSEIPANLINFSSDVPLDDEERYIEYD